MAQFRGRLLTVLAGIALTAALVALAADRPAVDTGDPLAAELRRWSSAVEADTSADETAVYVREMAAPVLSVASLALKRGRRLQALTRLASVHTMLAAQAYARAHPLAGRSLEGLEAEWKQVGAEISGDSTGPRSLEEIRPAAVRALAEASLPQARIYHEASLEYGRNTMPDAGLFYLGEAVAQRQFVALCRALHEPSAPTGPRLRDLGPELDALQSEMLALYRPPLSIDRHPEFIGASAALKEARALNATGLHHGALLRYLQASARLQPLLANPPAFDSVATPARLRGYARRFGAGGDYSLGRLFLEIAQADVEDTTGGRRHASAAAIADVVLPRYLAALAPAKPARPAALARATVTLVRWPYT